MIVLDASVLIAQFDTTDAHHSRATALLLTAADEGLGANPLTLAEVMVGPARTGRIERAQTALARLGVSAIPFPADTAVRLAALRAATGLRMPDCCVVLAAQSTGGALATFRQALAKAATDLGLDVRD